MDELGSTHECPFPTDETTLYVAYFSSAEWNCFLALGWDLPVRVLDLWSEFVCATNGRTLNVRKNLLGCLAYFGLGAISAVEKDEMRNLAMTGGPYTNTEMESLLDYCQTDVDALVRLLPVFLPRIDVPRALLRGRYMVAVAKMEHHGIPVDVETLGLLRRQWGSIRHSLIEAVDREYHVYDGTSFKQDRFEAYLQRSGIHWPRNESGVPQLDDTTFRQRPLSTRRSRC